MDIIISSSNPKPIYEQIAEQIRAAVLTGQLKAGSPLPSMRYLAKELRISVITTKRAYENLEREGFIETVIGKGSYVAKRDIAGLRENEIKQIEGRLRKPIAEAKKIGMTLERLLGAVENIYTGESKL